jgi:putative NADH-flavin reductase
MKIAVFGASSTTGQLVVKDALAAGHQVVAFVRNPARLMIKDGRLAVIQGELNDQMAIMRTVTGTDAVISLLGPRGNVHEKPLTQGMKNILDAMGKQGVCRLVIVSTPSAADPNDEPDFRVRAMVGLVKATLRPAYDEIVSVAQLVRDSDRDWTIVRVPLLTNKPAMSQLKIGYLGKTKHSTRLSREDLAAFLLKQAVEPTYVRQAPVISN